MLARSLSLSHTRRSLINWPPRYEIAIREAFRATQFGCCKKFLRLKAARGEMFGIRLLFHSIPLNVRMRGGGLDSALNIIFMSVGCEMFGEPSSAILQCKERE